MKPFTTLIGSLCKTTLNENVQEYYIIKLNDNDSLTTMKPLTTVKLLATKELSSL